MLGAAVDGAHKNYVVHDSYVKELLRLDIRAALDAIVPMVGDLTSKVFVAGYMTALDRARQNANPDQLLRDWGFKG